MTISLGVKGEPWAVHPFRSLPPLARRVVFTVLCAVPPGLIRPGKGRVLWPLEAGWVMVVDPEPVPLRPWHSIGVEA